MSPSCSVVRKNIDWEADVKLREGPKLKSLFPEVLWHNRSLEVPDGVPFLKLKKIFEVVPFLHLTNHLALIFIILDFHHLEFSVEVPHNQL